MLRLARMAPQPWCAAYSHAQEGPESLCAHRFSGLMSSAAAAPRASTMLSRRLAPSGVRASTGTITCAALACLRPRRCSVARLLALPVQRELHSHTAMWQCYGTVLARCTEVDSQHRDRTSGSSRALGALLAPSASGTGEGAAMGAGGAAGARALPRTRQCTLEPPKPKLEMATVPPCQGVGSATTCMPSMPLQAACCQAELLTRRELPGATKTHTSLCHSHMEMCSMHSFLIAGQACNAVEGACADISTACSAE